jgi:hypothetical protein
MTPASAAKRVGAPRLTIVYEADLSGRYEWLPPLRSREVTVVLDRLALADLAPRTPVAFEHLQSWQQRSAEEHRVNELMRAIAAHPAVAALGRDGLRLVDFAAYRLRIEIVRLLRGWTLARAVGVDARAAEPICDPALPVATIIGVRAGLGLDLRLPDYSLPAALPGSAVRRAVARQLMRLTTCVSQPGRVRVAAVAAGKLALALAALAPNDLRASGVGLMPFPGLDHGNGLLLAWRRQLPLLATYGPARSKGSPLAKLPPRLDIENEPTLDRALTLLVTSVLASAAPEHAQALAALAGASRARSLRTIVLPSAAYGASRLLIEWAHARGLRVAAMQHGIYVFREFDGGDSRADVLFGWGKGTAEQIARWPGIRPRLHVVGVPGLHTRGVRLGGDTAGGGSGSASAGAGLGSASASVGSGGASAGAGFGSAPADALPRRVLIATSNTVDTPITPLGYCEQFLDVIQPTVERLMGVGAQFKLRPHPVEAPARYRRLLADRGLLVDVSPDGSFAQALGEADLLISAASSVAFEAAALAVPVLLWLGPAPRWLREEHLLAPWTETPAGTFTSADDLLALAEDLITRPAEGMRMASELSRQLARYAEPFDAARFATALRELGE